MKLETYKEEFVLSLFHHIHHKKGKHCVHHCGISHKKVNPKLNYTIYHCPCGKHSINKKSAFGHDFFQKEVRVEFREKRPCGGWHIENGKIIEKDLPSGRS